MEQSEKPEKAEPPSEAKKPPVEKPAAEKSPESKPEAAKPAGAEAGDAAPKPAAKKPAKKEAPPKQPLVDNEDGTITDPNSGLMWKKTDAWLDCHKFFTWPMHKEYLEKVNSEKFAGFEDWRLPSKADMVTLCDKKASLLDKNGTIIPMDPIFETGCVGNSWISECTDEQITRFDIKTGIETVFPPTEVWASIRVVRKP